MILMLHKVGIYKHIYFTYMRETKDVAGIGEGRGAYIGRETYGKETAWKTKV